MADEKYVVKAAFAIGGKGVIVCRNDEELVTAIKRCLEMSSTDVVQVEAWHEIETREDAE